MTAGAVPELPGHARRESAGFPYRQLAPRN